MLELRDVSVARGGNRLLERVSLSIAPGELVAVIGPNGAGKSTLLRCLAGVARPDDGTVVLDGTPLVQLGARACAREIAFLPQSGPVHWAITVERLVALGRMPHGAVPDTLDAADRAAVERAMAATDVRHLASRAVDTLSGGERARVLAARALSVEGRFLIADEPIQALDPRHQLDLLAIFRTGAEAGMGIAVALHDLTLAARFCTRLVLIDRGRKVADGAATLVLTTEHLHGVYGIDAVTGDRDGEPFIVPWRVTSS
jgi:iron complex transport system ATP-binding protein